MKRNNASFKIEKIRENYAIFSDFFIKPKNINRNKNYLCLKIYHSKKLRFIKLFKFE